MLDITMEDGIIHVKESILSFIDTKVSHFYYDLNKKTQSSLGRLGDRCDRPMSERDVEWVKRHYLPKAKPPAAEVAKDPGVLTSAQHASISAYVTASMEQDGFYSSHSREQCAAERLIRYETQEATLRELALQGRRVMAPKVPVTTSREPDEAHPSF